MFKKKTVRRWEKFKERIEVHGSDAGSSPVGPKELSFSLNFSRPVAGIFISGFSCAFSFFFQ